MDASINNYAECDYETQFFGFTPESFVNGVYNAFNDYTMDCFEEFERLLKSEPSLSGGQNSEQLHEACEKMKSNFFRSIDGVIDRFEVYMKKNIFKIPPHVLLPEDKVHKEHQFTREDEQKIDKEIEELETKIKAAKYVNAALRQEIKDLNGVQEQVNNVEKELDSVQTTSGTVGGLKQTLVFTCDQAKKVHSLLSDGLELGAFQVQNSSKSKDPSHTRRHNKIKIG